MSDNLETLSRPLDIINVRSKFSLCQNLQLSRVKIMLTVKLGSENASCAWHLVLQREFGINPVDCVFGFWPKQLPILASLSAKLWRSLFLYLSLWPFWGNVRLWKQLLVVLPSCRLFFTAAALPAETSWHAQSSPFGNQKKWRVPIDPTRISSECLRGGITQKLWTLQPMNPDDSPYYLFTKAGILHKKYSSVNC